MALSGRAQAAPAPATSASSRASAAQGVQGVQGVQATQAAPGAQAAPRLAQWPQDARVSLELRRAPLSTLLSVLSAQSGVRFRLATIPDAEVSVSLQNAPLRQAVTDLLALQGFGLRPGPDAFWLVPAPAPQREDARSGAWRWWTGTVAPPPHWMSPDASEVAYDGGLTASGVPGIAPFGVRVRMQPEPVLLSRWKGSVQKFQAASPGVLPSPGALTALSALPGASGAAPHWCARWPVFLRAVPSRCLLVIESERPANLYVNGARLLHLWSGRRTIDVSGALQAGPNLLALEWLPLPPLPPLPAPVTSSTSSKKRAASAVFEPAPSVRYEWLVAQ